MSLFTDEEKGKSIASVLNPASGKAHNGMPQFDPVVQEQTVLPSSWSAIKNKGCLHVRSWKITDYDDSALDHEWIPRKNLKIDKKLSQWYITD